MSLFRSFLKPSPDIDPNFSENLKKLENKLSHLPEERAQYLAALAMLLGRVAYADQEISEKEKDKMIWILTHEMKLEPEHANMVSQIAIEQTLRIATDQHIVTRKLKKMTNHSERENLIRSLFLLATEDEISNEESEEIRNISTALGVDHSSFVRIRSEYREHLSVLKNLP